MADVAAPAPAKKAPKDKKLAVKPAHPPFDTMIAAAVNALKDRKGSSRQAILKYILANNKISDDKKAKARLRSALIKGVESGVLSQVKGSGASGSFKIAKAEKPVKVVTPKKPAAKKAPMAKKPVVKKAAKKPAAKKVASPVAKKPVAKKPVAKEAAKKPAAKKAAKKPAAKK